MSEVASDTQSTVSFDGQESQSSGLFTIQQQRSLPEVSTTIDIEIIRVSSNAEAQPSSAVIPPPLTSIPKLEPSSSLEKKPESASASTESPKSVTFAKEVKVFILDDKSLSLSEDKKPEQKKEGHTMSLKGEKSEEGVQSTPVAEQKPAEVPTEQQKSEDSATAIPVVEKQAESNSTERNADTVTTTGNEASAANKLTESAPIEVKAELTSLAISEEKQPISTIESNESKTAEISSNGEQKSELSLDQSKTVDATSAEAITTTEGKIEISPIEVKSDSTTTIVTVDQPSEVSSTNEDKSEIPAPKPSSIESAPIESKSEISNDQNSQDTTIIASEIKPTEVKQDATNTEITISNEFEMSSTEQKQETSSNGSEVKVDVIPTETKNEGNIEVKTDNTTSIISVEQKSEGISDAVAVSSGIIAEQKSSEPQNDVSTDQKPANTETLPVEVKPTDILPSDQKPLDSVIEPPKSDAPIEKAEPTTTADSIATQEIKPEATVINGSPPGITPIKVNNIVNETENDSATDVLIFQREKEPPSNKIENERLDAVKLSEPAVVAPPEEPQIEAEVKASEPSEAPTQVSSESQLVSVIPNEIKIPESSSSEVKPELTSDSRTVEETNPEIPANSTESKIENSSAEQLQVISPEENKTEQPANEQRIDTLVQSAAEPPAPSSSLTKAESSTEISNFNDSSTPQYPLEKSQSEQKIANKKPIVGSVENERMFENLWQFLKKDSLPDLSKADDDDEYEIVEEIKSCSSNTSSLYGSSEQINSLSIDQKTIDLVDERLAQISESEDKTDNTLSGFEVISVEMKNEIPGGGIEKPAENELSGQKPADSSETKLESISAPITEMKSDTIASDGDSILAEIPVKIEFTESKPESSLPSTEPLTFETKSDVTPSSTEKPADGDNILADLPVKIESINDDSILAEIPVKVETSGVTQDSTQLSSDTIGLTSEQPAEDSILAEIPVKIESSEIPPADVKSEIPVSTDEVQIKSSTDEIKPEISSLLSTDLPPLEIKAEAVGSEDHKPSDSNEGQTEIKVEFSNTTEMKQTESSVSESNIEIPISKVRSGTNLTGSGSEPPYDEIQVDILPVERKKMKRVSSLSEGEDPLEPIITYQKPEEPVPLPDTTVSVTSDSANIDNLSSEIKSEITGSTISTVPLDLAPHDQTAINNVSLSAVRQTESASFEQKPVDSIPEQKLADTLSNASIEVQQEISASTLAQESTTIEQKPASEALKEILPDSSTITTSTEMKSVDTATEQNSYEASINASTEAKQDVTRSLTEILEKESTALVQTPVDATAPFETKPEVLNSTTNSSSKESAESGAEQKLAESASTVTPSGISSISDSITTNERKAEEAPIEIKNGIPSSTDKIQETPIKIDTSSSVVKVESSSEVNKEPSPFELSSFSMSYYDRLRQHAIYDDETREDVSKRGGTINITPIVVQGQTTDSSVSTSDHKTSFTPSEAKPEGSGEGSETNRSSLAAEAMKSTKELEALIASANQGIDSQTEIKPADKPVDDSESKLDALSSAVGNTITGALSSADTSVPAESSGFTEIPVVSYGGDSSLSQPEKVAEAETIAFVDFAAQKSDTSLEASGANQAEEISKQLGGLIDGSQSHAVSVADQLADNLGSSATVEATASVDFSAQKPAESDNSNNQSAQSEFTSSTTGVNIQADEIGKQLGSLIDSTQSQAQSIQTLNDNVTTVTIDDKPSVPSESAGSAITQIEIKPSDTGSSIDQPKSDAVAYDSSLNMAALGPVSQPSDVTSQQQQQTQTQSSDAAATSQPSQPASEPNSVPVEKSSSNDIVWIREPTADSTQKQTDTPVLTTTDEKIPATSSTSPNVTDASNSLPVVNKEVDVIVEPTPVPIQQIIPDSDGIVWIREPALGDSSEKTHDDSGVKHVHFNDTPTIHPPPSSPSSAGVPAVTEKDKGSDSRPSDGAKTAEANLSNGTIPQAAQIDSNGKVNEPFSGQQKDIPQIKMTAAEPESVKTPEPPKDAARLDTKPQADEVSVASSLGESIDLSDIERQMEKSMNDTKNILGEMGDKSSELKEKNEDIARRIAEERRHLLDASVQPAEMKTINDFEQLPPPPTLPTGGLTDNVESVLIGNGLTHPSGAIVLPDASVLVTDLQQGILIFDFGGNLLNKIQSDLWKNPRSPVYHKEHVLFIADYKDADNHWERHIVKYSAANMQYIAKIEGPMWLKEHTVWREKLSIALNDFIYLNVCGEIFSGLYELSPVGQWTELEYKLSESWTDMIAFATIGPITQLLIIEGRKNYVIMLSVRESEVVDRRRMAICDRPGALAKDEAGRLFVANRFLASIQLVDTRVWASAKNVAICDAMIPYFSVSWGLVVIPLANSIRLHKYNFR